jgi:hypothetical protein
LNKFMRAIGFSRQLKRKELSALIAYEIHQCDQRAYTSNDEDEDSILAQYDLSMGGPFGICVCGQFDENDQFFPDYWYPYLRSDEISSGEGISVEPRIDNDTYAGVCEDLRVGVTLIFRLQNTVEYLKNTHTSFQPLQGASVSLAALSTEGTILMPLYKTQEEEQRSTEERDYKVEQLRKAKNGDDEANRVLTAMDMEQYAGLMSQIRRNDIYTVVESYLMPYGAECELYSLLGEICKISEFRNKVSDEKVYVLRVDCNGLCMDVMINQEDLYGEPEIGRRFRGSIWMQGRIHFTN